MKFLLFLIILIFCRIETQVAVDLFYCYFIRFLNYISNMGFPRWRSGKESTCQCRNCRRRGFDLWVGKILWNRKWQPTLVFLSEKFHGQKRLVGYSP